jgi:hypothetical protein
MKITALGSEARLAMDTRLQNEAKAPSPFSASPVQTGLFQSRPFTEPEQESAEAQDSSHQPPDLQTQLDRASRLGHNFSRVQVQSNTPAVIQQQPISEQTEEQQDEQESDWVTPIKMMAPPVGNPIQRESEEEPIQMMPQLGWLSPRIQRESEEEEPIQMQPQLGWLQRLPQDDDDLPIQMMPRLRLLQRQEPEADEEPQMQRIQLKVVVGQPGDKYEQEADSMAAQVMSMSAPPTNSVPIQRQGEEQEQEPLVQRSSLADSITPLVQRQTEEQEEPLQAKSLLQRAGNGNALAGSNVQSQLNSSKGGGSPLPDEVRSFMEPRFGVDFGSVRVHTGSSAVQMNKDLHAQAFAHGSDIYYGSGKSPGKDALTAHELTHVVQQKGAVRLNKELRRQPKQQEEEKEQLQRQQLRDRTPEAPSNKELRLQPIEEQEEKQPLQAKELGDRTPEAPSNKELRLQPLEEQEEAEPLQAKELGDRTPEVSPNKELRLQPLEEQEEAEPLQAKELGDRTPEASSNKELRLQPLEEQEEQQPLQAKELGDRTPEVSPNKELRLQPQQEQAEAEPIQTKQLPDRTPEVPSNKELRLQPIEEQAQAEPLQAKELPDRNPQLSFNKTLQRLPEETDRAVIQPKIIDGGFTPSPPAIQRISLGDTLRSGGNALSTGWNTVRNAGGAVIEGGRALVSGGRDLLERGLDWVRNNIIQPLLRLAQSGWGAVSNFGNQISNAFRQANPNIWDVFMPQHLVFRTATNLRRQLFAQAIQAERSQRARVAANIQGSGPAPVQEPSQLERLDGLMTQVESFPAAGFDIGKQLLQGAVVGDFNENPTIWNTIGQVAIGFVPYAGQVADIRDIVANVIQLRRSGYRDPDAWINLGLSCIGIIPGVGDIIKAVGRGSRGVIRSALSGVLRNADGVLRPVLGRAGGILRGARRYGSQFVGWASQQGARLRQSVTGFAQRAVNFARSAGQRARSLVSAVRARVGQLLNGAVQRAQSITNQAQGLLGRVMSQFMAMAQRAFSAVQSRVSQAVSSVRRLVERGRELASRVAQRVAQVTRRAATLVREFTQSAIQRGQQALQAARQWSSQEIKKATELGRRLVKNARDRVASLVRNGVKLAKEKAIPFIKQKLGGIKQRILGFLKDRWNRLKEKLGIKKPGKPGKEGAERGGKETGGGGGQKETLLKELAENGVKHNADDIIRIARGPDGKIVFLEKGNSRAGLQHIIEAHADDFARRGVPQDQIPDLVMTAVTEGKIVGSQGKGRASGGGRAIYEVTYGGKKHYVAVSVGNNGFIVGANPASPPSL